MNFTFDEAGWLQSSASATPCAVTHIASPNCDERPQAVAPELIVLHAISLPPDQFGGAGVEQLFTNTLDPCEHPYYEGICALRVSAHFFIRRDGQIVQFVPVLARAWHAGVSSWKGRERCNDFSVGIELEGCDTQAFCPIQYEVLAQLVHSLQHHYGLPDIAGHSDIAPGRKTDPGPCFDWAHFEALRKAAR